MTVRIEPETRGALDESAAKPHRDRSYVVNQALAAYIETHRWQASIFGRACAKLRPRRLLPKPA